MPNPHREFEEARRMLVRAVAEIKGGEFNTARYYLERVLNVPARMDQKADAYYWLSEITESEDKKRDYLQSALGYDLSHHRARKSLAVLDGKLKKEEVVDPDRYVAEELDAPQAREGKRFECPNCGSPMVYSPDGGNLFCEHCAGQLPTDGTNRLNEHEFVIGISTAKGHQHPRATQSFECDACGAIFILAPQVISLNCPHCGSSYAVIHTNERNLIPPEGVIPFKVAEQDVDDKVLGWCNQQDLDTRYIHLGHFTGIYLPAWTFDVMGTLKWTGYQEFGQNQIIPVNDSATIHFDDVFVPASKPQPKYLLNLLEEFHAEDVQAYAAEFTANFLAESYQVSMSDAAIDARALVFKKAKNAQKEKSGMRRVENLHFISDDIFLESYKLVLVPVWMGMLTAPGGQIDILVNGKTGKVYADKPTKRRAKLLGWLLGE